MISREIAARLDPNLYVQVLYVRANGITYTFIGPPMPPEDILAIEQMMLGEVVQMEILSKFKEQGTRH